MANLSYNEIAKSIYDLSVDKKGDDLKDVSNKVVQFLVKKGLLSKAPEILSSLKKIIYKEEGVLEARIISKDKLNNDTVNHIIHLLKHRYNVKEVILEEIIDKRAIAGFRVEVGEEIIDLTFRNKIKALKEFLTKPA